MSDTKLAVLFIAGVLLASNIVFCEGLKIGAFNVDILGRTKIGKTDVVNVLEQIIRRYDVILLQDIRDQGQTAVLKLSEVLNKDLEEKEYQYEVSEPLGRTRNKERYAYFYKTNTVEVYDTHQFDDPDDEFEREPFSIFISSKQTNGEPAWKFFLLGVHVKPSNVCSELGALGNAYRTTSQVFNSTSGFILGDLNADCTYLSGCDFQELEIVKYPSASWLIDFSEDTTATPTYCAYDRIIAVGDTRDHVVPDSAQVYRFDKDLSLTPEQVKNVSHHYPVEVQITNKGRCLKNITLIVVLSTHRHALSRGPHTLRITTPNKNITITLQDKNISSNQLEFYLNFIECLKPDDIQCISIVPGSTDAWIIRSVITLAHDCFGDVTLLTCDININFPVDQDNSGNGRILRLTHVEN